MAWTVMRVATKRIIDLFDDKTMHIIGGSQQFIFLSLYNSNSQGIAEEPLNISNLNEIQWLLSPYSVLKEKNTALIEKRLTQGHIKIVKDGRDGKPNRIQITLQANDTKNLQGAFLYQIVVTDNVGGVFIPFEGIININKKIQL
jgi:hypothetical protein